MNSLLRFVAFMGFALVLSAQTAPSAVCAKPYEDLEAYTVYAAVLARPNSGQSSLDVAIISRRTFIFENCYEPDEQWRELLVPVVENYKKVNQTPWDLVDSLIRFPHKLLSADEMHKLFSKGPKKGWKRFHRKYRHKLFYTFRLSALVLTKL